MLSRQPLAAQSPCLPKRYKLDVKCFITNKFEGLDVTVLGISAGKYMQLYRVVCDIAPVQCATSTSTGIEDPAVRKLQATTPSLEWALRIL